MEVHVYYKFQLSREHLLFTWQIIENVHIIHGARIWNNSLLENRTLWWNEALLKAANVLKVCFWLRLKDCGLKISGRELSQWKEQWGLYTADWWPRYLGILPGLRLVSSRGLVYQKTCFIFAFKSAKQKLFTVYISLRNKKMIFVKSVDFAKLLICGNFLGGLGTRLGICSYLRWTFLSSEKSALIENKMTMF